MRAVVFILKLVLKIAAAPVETPIAGSKSSSGRILKLICARLIKRASSRVVRTISTSSMPEPAAS